MIPTTDEMDRTTPEERVKLKGQCSVCDEWNDLVRDQSTLIPHYLCSCGGRILIKSVQSARTWTAKKRRR